MRAACTHAAKSRHDTKSYDVFSLSLWMWKRKRARKKRWKEKRLSIALSLSLFFRLSFSLSLSSSFFHPLFFTLSLFHSFYLNSHNKKWWSDNWMARQSFLSPLHPSPWIIRVLSKFQQFSPFILYKFVPLSEFLWKLISVFLFPLFAFWPIEQSVVLHDDDLASSSVSLSPVSFSGSRAPIFLLWDNLILQQQQQRRSLKTGGKKNNAYEITPSEREKKRVQRKETISSDRLWG